MALSANGALRAVATILVGIGAFFFAQRHPLVGQSNPAFLARLREEEAQRQRHEASLRRGTSFLISRAQPTAVGIPSVMGGTDEGTQAPLLPESLPSPRESLPLGELEPQRDAGEIQSYLQGNPFWLPWHRPEWLTGELPLQGEHAPRFNGFGHPLATTSWKNRPFGASWFLGGMWGTGLINNRVDQGNGIFGGFRLGWDFDHYLGGETRLGFASLGIHFPPDNPLPPGESGVLVWDLNLLYYPWGDAQWRPYALVGLGLASFNFDDDRDQRVNQQVLGMPFGFGVKYHFSETIVLRAEFLDNVAFGSGGGLENMHNLSLTAGVEYRFGGKRRSYWPWNPSRWLTF